MGNIQILISHKCCNDDLEIDNDDDEKPPMVRQKPVLKTTTDKKDKLINTETDSFTTTIPCFSNN